MRNARLAPLNAPGFTIWVELGKSPVSCERCKRSTNRMKDVLSRANLEGVFRFETYHRKLQYSLIYEAQPKTRSKI